MSARGWWYQASTAERLAQIDGCIEVGMTTNQCAMNLGCYDAVRAEGFANAVIGNFAHYHGRSFPMDEDKQAAANRKVSVARLRRLSFMEAKQSYLSGEPVDFWSAK